MRLSSKMRSNRRRPLGGEVGRPQPFDVVEVAHLRLHHVDHDPVEVDQGPFAVLQPFGAERRLARFLGAEGDGFGDGLDVTVGGA